VVTSGKEQETELAFFSGNRWRFSDRVPWWSTYDERIPVVIGHYWRLFNPVPGQVKSRYSELFDDLPPFSWHGLHNNVFCVDYSVGARWRERYTDNSRHIAPERSQYRLAALQWPEQQLVFDTGERVATQNQPGSN